DERGRVVVIRVPGGAELTRNQIDGYAEFGGIYGEKGLAWMKVNDREAGVEGIQSPVAKFLSEDMINGILDRTQAESGDIILFGADKANIVAEAIGALRLKLVNALGLPKEGTLAPRWAVDFPLFEED
ncbi:aspartyl-tRNA synthetase, partial [Vibrio parahaemolyticus]|uniref:GAD domain-containing protein n=1 Tax=Vibrio parahaemolyticus TaxID=670 RepID=UPI00062AF787